MKLINLLAIVSFVFILGCGQSGTKKEEAKEAEEVVTTQEAVVDTGAAEAEQAAADTTSEVK